MIDLADLAKLIANILGGVSILAVVVFAAVAYLKQWGVKGKWLTGSGFAVGLVLAFAARFMVAPPANLQDWLATVFLGLMAGFLATGAYKGAEGLATKAGATVTTGSYTTYSTGADGKSIYFDLEDADEPEDAQP